VLPWIQLDTATMPDGGGELRLKQRGSEFSIMLGTIELMNSRLSGSEEQLARLSFDRIKSHPKPHMLIGGLGMGFTLRAALDVVGDDARITVGELVPAVVEWARGPMADVFKGCLDDGRVDIALGDVGVTIGKAKARYDAILLDVDNGPEGLTRRKNDDLYSVAGLRVAKAALRPNGVLSVWSSAPDAGFTRRLRDAGFAVEELKVRASTKGSGARHVIWMATKKAG
jgi:spermidine synthase